MPVEVSIGSFPIFGTVGSLNFQIAPNISSILSLNNPTRFVTLFPPNGAVPPGFLVGTATAIPEPTALLLVTAFASALLSIRRRKAFDRCR
jgi:hypothetical protein